MRADIRAVSAPSFLNLAAALGLPGDRLSASVLSFFRFFSLPFDPLLLARMRSRVLGAPETAADTGPAKDAAGLGEEAMFRSREALSLAAAAALSKGTELGGEALERYARAMDPAFPGRRQGEDSRESTGRESPGGGSAGGEYDSSESYDSSASPGNSRSGSGGSSSGGAGEEVDACDGASALRKRAAFDPLLDILNRLPGRDGKRWIVVPFVFGPQEQYRVTLRLLSGPDFPGGKEGRVDRMALEIAAKNGERWLFVVDRPERPAFSPEPGGASGGKHGLKGARLSFGRLPSPGNRTLLAIKRELSGLLGLSGDQIYLKNDDFFSFFAPDSRDDVLPSVNKEV
ncbi:MAG: hypothetical protein LBK08_02600 [Treponema sp.]|nr:hypothetical protein [Treponema sp.]